MSDSDSVGDDDAPFRETVAETATVDTPWREIVTMTMMRRVARQ